MTGDSAEKEVFRPGWLQYLFLVPPTAFFALIGGAMAITQPLSGYTVLAVALSVVSGLILLNILGLRIELDDERLAKVYFFGLFRQSIAISQLHATRDDGPRATTVSFESADGKGPGFEVMRSAVWPGSDIDRLYDIAIRSERKRGPQAAATTDQLWPYGDTGSSSEH